MFSALSGFIGSVFGAAMDTKAFAVSTVIGALVNTVLNNILINILGVMGAAIATLISFVVVWAMRMIMSRRYIKWKIHIIRDLVCYLLLIAQIVAEHMEGHCYPMQITLMVLIMAFNCREVKAVCRKSYGWIKRKIVRSPYDMENFK